MFFYRYSSNRGEKQISSTASIGDITSVTPESTVKHHESVGAACLLKDSALAVPPAGEELASSRDVEWIHPRLFQKLSSGVVVLLVSIGLSVLVVLLVVIETTDRSNPQILQVHHPEKHPTVATVPHPQVASLRPIAPLTSPSLSTKTNEPASQPAAPSPGFPACYICGNSIRQVTRPNGTVLFPGLTKPILCSQLEYGGVHGFVDPKYCPMLTLFKVADSCGCTGETNAPVAATPSPTTLSPTQQPSSAAASSRFNELLSFLLNQSISDEQYFYNRSSPQFHALHWLANKDPAQLEISNATLKAIQKRYVMATIFIATGGVSWYDSSNFLSGDEICWWHDPLNTTGVFCKPLRLQLGSNILYGFVVGEIGRLSDLQALDLSVNNLVGTLPTELGLLTELTSLNMESNVFVSSIPSSFGQMTVLQFLNLGENSLSGTLPIELQNLKKLKSLGLNANTLRGEILSEVASFSNLQSLQLGSNEFSGFVPAELGSLSKLESLGLKSNRFSGTVPTELGLLDHLIYLDVSGNLMNGTIPTNLASLANLTELYLHGNNFEGNLTPFFCDHQWDNFEADCLKKVECSCCTKCY